MSNAVDCTGLSPSQIANLAKNGVKYVGRYLAHSSWKALNVGEVANIKAAGLQIFSIYESNSTQESYFSSAKGKSDALDAINLAKAIGQPTNTAIYFTVDYDAQASDLPAILAYFKAVKANLVGYKVGAYGSFTVLNYLHENKVADYWFQTMAWSNGQRNKFLHIYQYQCDKQFAGVNVDLDNLEQTDVGAWGNVVVKPTVQPKPQQPKPKPKPTPQPKPQPVAQPTFKEEDDMLETAIVINGFADFGTAEPLAAKLKAPIYTRAALPAGKIANELYVVGGNADGLQADKVIPLTGADRYEVAAAVKKFLG